MATDLRIIKGLVSSWIDGKNTGLRIIRGLVGTRINQESSTSKPVITVTAHTKDKISSITDMTTCTVTFQSSTALLEWEARADGTGHGLGTLVGSGTTAEANSNVQFNITYDELLSGDKTYTIYVYGRNSAGWSDDA